MCKVCASIQTNPDKSSRALAEQLGVGKSTILRHRNNPCADNDVDAFFGIPNSIITSRGKTTRLVDGSYEKITYKPNELALLEANNLEGVRRLLDDFKPDYEPLEPKSEEALVLNLADLQIGKTDIHGGTPETIQRVINAVDKFVKIVRIRQPKSLVLVDNGDPIENCWNTPSQPFTNDLDVPAQIDTFRRLIVQVLKAVAPLCKDVYYVTVTSNHGQFRVGPKAQGGSVDADFGLSISRQLEDICAESPALKHVKFIRPEPMHETAVLTVANTKLAFNHGHLSSGVNGHGNWWAKVDHGRLPGWDADILVVAHYHTLGLEQSGDGRWIIKVSSPDNGSQWFTAKSGESSVQGLTMFAVHDGQWSDLTIL